jgi:hypothetical protein
MSIDENNSIKFIVVKHFVVDQQLSAINSEAKVMFDNFLQIVKGQFRKQDPSRVCEQCISLGKMHPGIYWRA